MSDSDELEVFTIKDPRPLTAKLEPESDTALEDFRFKDDKKESENQSKFDLENAFSLTISKKILQDSSFTDLQKSESVKEKSGGEKGEKRGNNKVSSSIMPSSYQKRKIRKKDSKQKLKSFNKRFGASSSTSSINYQTHARYYSDSDSKAATHSSKVKIKDKKAATNENDKASNVQTANCPNKGTTKDRTIKRKNGHSLQGKNYPGQNQIFSSSSTSSCNQLLHKNHEKNTEISIVSGREGHKKKNDASKNVHRKEEQKPNNEHIAKLAEINVGCSKPKRESASLEAPPHDEGMSKDEEPMDEYGDVSKSTIDSCELMDVSDTQIQRNDVACCDVVMDNQVVHQNVLTKENDGSKDLYSCDVTRDKKINISDHKIGIQLHDDSNISKKHNNTMTNLEEKNLEERALESNQGRVDLPESRRSRVRLTNFSLSMPVSRDRKRSEDEEDAPSTWLLDCRNIWSSNKLKGNFYQGGETRERVYSQHTRSQGDYGKKPANKVTNNRFIQNMKSTVPSRAGCIMRTVKQGSFVLLGTVKTLKDDRERLSY